MCARFVAEHPIGSRREAVQQPFRAQEINVRERREEEQPFDARCKADQVQQELLAVLIVSSLFEVLDRIHPLKAELGFFLDRRNFSIAANAAARSSDRGCRCRAVSGRTERAPLLRKAAAISTCAPPAS